MSKPVIRIIKDHSTGYNCFFYKNRHAGYIYFDENGKQKLSWLCRQEIMNIKEKVKDGKDSYKG